MSDKFIQECPDLNKFNYDHPDLENEVDRCYNHIDNLEKQLKLQRDIKLIFRCRIDKLEALKNKADHIINGPSCNCVDGQCNYCQNCREYLKAAKELG